MATENFDKIFNVELNASDAIAQLTQYNKAIDQNNAKLKELKANNAQNSEEYTKITQIIATQKRERNELQKVVQNNIKIEREQQGSLKSMRAELSLLNKKFDEMSLAERKSATGGQALQKQIQSLTNDIKKAEYETERYYRNVGNYEQSILSAIGVQGNFSTALLSGANSTSVMRAEIGALGKSLTGLLANPAFLAIAGLAGVGVAVSMWADYNKDIAEATRLTKQFLDISGDELVNLRAEIRATADTFGKEYIDVLKSVDALTANYGITAEKAITIINDGFASGADINGTFLQQINSNAGAFSNLSNNAEELVALIQQTQSGIFSQDGLKIMEVASGRLKVMSNTTQSALRGIGIDATELQKQLENNEISYLDAVTKVSAHIHTLGTNSHEAGIAIKEIFGKSALTMSAEMITAFENLGLDLDELKKKADGYYRMQGEIQKQTAEMEKQSADLFAIEGGGWDYIKGKAEVYFKSAVTNYLKFANTMKRFYTEIAEAFVWLGYKISGVVNAGKVMVNGFVGYAKDIADAFGSVGDVITGAFTLDTDRIKKGIDGVKNLYNTLATHTRHVGEQMRNEIAKAGEGFSQTKSKIEESVFGKKGDYTQPVVTPTEVVDDVKGGGGGGGKPTPTPKVTKEATKAVDDAEKELEKLRSQLLNDYNRLMQQDLQQAKEGSVAGINAYFDAQANELKARFSGLGQMSDEEAEMYSELLADIDEKRQKAIADFEAQAQKRREEQLAKAQSEGLELKQLQIENTPEGSAERMQMELDLLAMQMEQKRALYKDNEEMITAINAEEVRKRNEIEREHTMAVIESITEKARATANVLGQGADLLEQFAGKSKAVAVASKALAVAEIAINTGTAIAKGISQAQSVPFPANIAAIASTISAILTGIASAKKAVQSAKFATGGYVSGEGTATSDSIPARLSNGESVINANSTAMFSGLLSAINQIGGGVPIQAGASMQQVAGEAQLARAFAMGAKALPAPVVDIREFVTVNDRVATIKENAKL